MNSEVHKPETTPKPTGPPKPPPPQPEQKPLKSPTALPPRCGCRITPGKHFYRTRKMESRLKLGLLIKAAREQRGMSKAELSRRIGKTGTAVGMFETGKRPRGETMALIILALEMDDEQRAKATILFEEAGGTLPGTALSLLEPIPQRARLGHKLLPIVAFLRCRACSTLIRAILDLQDSGVTLSDEALWTVVAMGYVAKADLPQKLWSDILLAKSTDPTLDNPV